MSDPLTINGPGLPAPVFRPEALRAVEVHGKPMTSSHVEQRVDLRRESVDVDGTDGGGARRQIALDVSGIQRERARQAIAENRNEAIPHERLRGGRKRK